MINRYFYQSDVKSFLAEGTDTIFGKMSRADEMDTASTQKFAWEQEITIMNPDCQVLLKPERWRLQLLLRLRLSLRWRRFFSVSNERASLVFV